MSLDLEARLRAANLAFARRYPGECADGAQQPVHTFIEGAHRFHARVARERGDEALGALDAHGESSARDPLLRRKLETVPIEDYRIDFEDGYGVRSDADEDAEVARVVDEIARGVRAASLPPSLGARIKPLTEELCARSIRTLTRLTTALADRDALPARWIVTLPKVTVVEQVEYFVDQLQQLERSLGIAERTLRFEIQVEVPQVIVDHTGRSTLPAVLSASDGRLQGANFGVYDYTAGCGVSPLHQGLRHPAAEFARHTMQAAFAGTGVWLSDGSTATLPVGDAGGVRAGWKLHAENVRRALAEGFPQGWDLHAAQLVSRHAAVMEFYAEGLELVAARMRAYLAKVAEAELVGGTLDEPATGQMLSAFLARAIAVGVTTEDDVQRRLR